jgi:hypothetical protein
MRDNTFKFNMSMSEIVITFLSRRQGQLLLWLAFFFPLFTYAQEVAQIEKANYFGGAVTVTSNGISLLPSFSLGKPAAIFDMKVGRKLTFEPQFRMSLAGKPWSFVFWWRYQVIDKDKFRMRVGAHPAVLFRTTTITNNGITSEVIEVLRYVAAEISPDYYISKHVSIGLYYLHGHGLQDTGVKYSDFITINTNFSHIKLVKEYFLKFKPQLYYLAMDGSDGFYFTATSTLAKDNFPLSVESIINLPIQSDITGGQDFIWNLSLVYSFGKEYVRK